MSRRFARLGRLGAFLVAVAASSARADDEERVLLIGADPTRAPLPRLAAELETLGFRVIRGKSESRPSIWSAEVAVRRAHAVGAIHVDATAQEMEIWVASPQTGRLSRRGVLRGDPLDGERAVRAVEILRAGLIDTRGDPPLVAAAPDRVGPDSAAPVDPPDRPRRFGVEVAVGVAVSPGGVGASAPLVAGAHWMPSRHLGLHGLLVLGVGSAEVEAPEGTATVRAGLAGGGLRLAWTGPARVSPAAELGLAGYWLDTSGVPASGFVAADGATAGVAPDLRVGVGVSIASWLCARADLLAAVAMPTPVVSFAGREVARWGSPLFVPSSGLQVVW